MHLPSHHVEKDIPTLWKLIRDSPLGIFTTAISSSSGSFPLIQSTHIPFVLDTNDDGKEGEDYGPYGRLRAHLARQNPQCKAMIEAITGSTEAGQRTTGDDTLEQEVLVLFTSPVNHYVTPKFYTETKPVTGKVVPTWNYAAVQVYGKAKIYFDSKSDETGRFLATQIGDLSHQSETRIMDYTGQGDRPGPWKVTDAPPRYIELLQKNIVGIEIKIDRLEGKFKMSQEMSKGDRDGVVKGFKTLGTEVGMAISDIVQTRSDMHEEAKAQKKG
ncbi:hypothetical protein ACRALDRAFT_2108884 [Sodiomyces alcalophilus JCM 7366]|uniref:uncharacterized protein n=1 Tax=Sodiomyces alcalophilus JCM 7366 TaxID=591952 RepID=UPI0039B3CA50